MRAWPWLGLLACTCLSLLGFAGLCGLQHVCWPGFALLARLVCLLVCMRLLGLACLLVVWLAGWLGEEVWRWIDVAHVIKTTVLKERTAPRKEGRNARTLRKKNRLGGWEGRREEKEAQGLKKEVGRTERCRMGGGADGEVNRLRGRKKGRIVEMWLSYRCPQ